MVRSTVGNTVTPIKILMCIPTAELARYAEFYDWVDLLEKPENVELYSCRTHGQSPARSRNIMIQQAIETKCDYVFFIDDDVLLPPDTLKKLLAHDKDVVGGLYVMRNSPHQAVMFDIANDDGTCRWYGLNDIQRGLIPVVATGLGCLLIKVEVLKKIRELYRYWITMGELEADMWCDDLAFFKRVRECGYQGYVDLNCPVGHIAKVIVWPNLIDNKWHITYNTQGTSQVNVPVTQRELELVEK